VRAEPPAERGVQQVGRRVVALGRVPCSRLDARETRSRSAARLLEHDEQRLVIAEPHNIGDARRQSPSSHSIEPTSETWPPPSA